MSIKNLLQTFAQTNLKANKQITDLLKDHMPKMDIELINSFSTLRLTLLHIWDAETIWLKRLKGESLDGFPSRFFSGENSEILELLLGRSKEFSRFHFR